MRKHLWSLLRKIAGVLLIILGIIGLFLPFLQGILMIIAGLLLLGVKKETIMKWLAKLKFWKKKKKKSK